MNRLIYALILIFFESAILLWPMNAMGDIGPHFDVQRLYQEVPVICKVTVEDVKSSLSPIIHKKRRFEASVAALKVHRCYKADLNEVVMVRFPSGKDIIENSLTVYGWAWRHIKKGQNLIVFLKQEGADYRFWYDVYDTFMPVPLKHMSNAKGFNALREDIVNSVNEESEIAEMSIGQIKDHGWLEALPKLKLITKLEGLKKYTQAVVARLFLGDRSSIEESLKFFDRENDFVKACYISPEKMHSMPEKIRQDCSDLQNSQSHAVYAYAELGSSKAQALVKSIAEGKMSWLHSNVVNSAKIRLPTIVTPREILEAGDIIGSISLGKGFKGKCARLCFNFKEPGYTVIKAAGRADWYYSVRSDFEGRQKIFNEMKRWWSAEGREIFLKEHEQYDY